MGRILGLDYGEKRIGLAMSDPMRIIASPHFIINHTSQKNDFTRISTFCKENDVDMIVVGIPTDISGEIGLQAQRVIRWGEKLARFTNLPVTFVDETFSSRFAHDLHTGKSSQREHIDHLAAAKILQDYLLALQEGGGG